MIPAAFTKHLSSEAILYRVGLQLDAFNQPKPFICTTNARASQVEGSLSFVGWITDWRAYVPLFVFENFKAELEMRK